MSEVMFIVFLTLLFVGNFLVSAASGFGTGNLYDPSMAFAALAETVVIAGLVAALARLLGTPLRERRSEG